MAGPTIQHVVRNKQQFVRKVRILKRNDFWNVSQWLAGAYRSSGGHLDQQHKPVLIGDEKVKWLDSGKTPNLENLEAHPGFVWVKSGYIEAIAWRKVQLTKQRNADLATDGPVTSRRMCAPMESHPLWRGATMRATQIQNNERSLVHCPVLCVVPCTALCSKL